MVTNSDKLFYATLHEGLLCSASITACSSSNRTPGQFFPRHPFPFHVKAMHISAFPSSCTTSHTAADAAGICARTPFPNHSAPS